MRTHELEPSVGKPLAHGSSPSSATPAPASSDAVARRVRAIVREHYDFLWRSLRRLGVAESAVEDAAQQVLCVVARRLADIREGAERAFVFGAAVRVASDVRRATQRRREDPSDDTLNDFAHPAPSPEDLVDERHARELLAGILDAMPIDLRSVFILFELEEMTMAEVAVVLEIPPGTVASRLRRARDVFQAALARIRGEE